jgi:16S rRNA (uracil1498-N3)-methyltransferase
VLASETAPHRFLLDSEGEPFPPILAASAVALLVGPEGGWSEREQQQALSHGWVAASLSAGKLRAETAAVAALTLARHALARGALTPPPGQ